jgi:uncharacterized membrane protein
MKKKKRNPSQRQMADANTTKTVATTGLDQILRGLAGAGLLLTLYLTWVAWQGQKVAFCTQGSGCDVIQSSQWSTFLGLPLALWGAGLYAGLLLVSFRATTKMKRWQGMWKLSLLGVIISAYLTVLGLVDLGTLCGWCLTSFALLLATFALLEINKRKQGLEGKRNGMFLDIGALGLGVAAIMFINSSDILSQRGDPRLHELAQHLTNTGAVFYGAHWCPSCREQKRLFGGAANKLPYVECAQGGPNAGMINRCVRAGVSGYPTWVIDSKQVVGVIQPENLAAISGYDWDAGEKQVKD